MKFFAAAVAIASLAFSSVNAHSTVHAIYVDGVDKGEGQDIYIRAPPNNNPLKDLTSTDLTCNVGGSSAAPQTIEVSAGQVITFQWNHDSRSASDDIIDPSHKGPVVVYIAPAASNGLGNVWVKIFDEAFTGGSWAVDKLIAARGKHSIIVPNIAPGEYLFRPEIFTLHEADTLFTQNAARGNQLYMACVQIKVVSSSSVSLPAGIAIPGNYKDSSPGILFNLYDGSNPANYVSPGGTVWTGAAGGAIGTVVASKPSTGVSSSVAAATSSKSTPTVITSATPAVTSSKATSTVVSSSAPAIVSSAKFSSSSIVKSTTTPAAVSSPAPVVCVPISTSSASPTVGVSAICQQCGGFNFNGPKTCATGLKCQAWNDWYHQCIPA